MRVLDPDEELFRRWRDDGDSAALAELFDRTAFTVTSGSETVVRGQLAHGWRRVLRFDLTAWPLPQHCALSLLKGGKRGSSSGRIAQWSSTTG